MQLLPITECDPEAFAEVFNDPPTRSIESEDHPFSVEASRKLVDAKRASWDAKTELSYGVFVGSDTVGMVSFHGLNWKHKFSQIFYWFDTSHRRKGYARAAVAQMIKIGFETLDLNRLEAQLRTDNIPSKSLLEALGFEREATQVEKWINNDRLYDGYQYRFLKSQYTNEWKANHLSTE